MAVARTRVSKLKSKTTKVARKAVRSRVATRRPKLRVRRSRPKSLEDQLVREARQAAKTPWIRWAVGALFVGTLVPVVYNLSPSQVQTAAPMSATVYDQTATDEIARSMAEVSGKSMGERVGYWALRLSSDSIPNLSKLPNRPEISDINPLVPQNFDCTTFVETVLALAKSATPSEFYQRLVGLRYHGSGNGFFDRNHFPEADWIPNNVASGTLTDVTLDVAKQADIEARTVRKRINRASWFTAQRNKGGFFGLAATEPASSWRTPVKAEVTYLPVENVVRYANHLPNGSVVNIVRGDNPKQWVLITHQAIVVQSNGETYLRHSTKEGQVKTTPLVSYLRNLGGGSWPIIGLNVERVASAP